MTTATQPSSSRSRAALEWIRRRRVAKWWAELTGRQQFGYLLTALAAALTFGLAVLRSGDSPPSAGWIIFLTVLGITAQAASAFTFGQVDRADPSHAQSSVRRLFTLARRAAESAKSAETIFEMQNPKPTQAELHKAMGILSTQLSYIAEDALGSIEDWRDFYEQAVSKVEGRTGKNGIATPRGNEQTASNVESEGMSSDHTAA